MKNQRKRQKGFLLVEVLILILILAVAFVSFTAVFNQALKIASRIRDITEALTQYERLVFEIESGLRPDLAAYGGRGNLGEGFIYEMESEEETAAYSFLHGHFFLKKDQELLEPYLFISRGSWQ